MFSIYICSELSLKHRDTQRAYYKTWPGLIGLAWPQHWPGPCFGLQFGPNPNFGLASKVGLASNLASKNFFGLNQKNFFSSELWLILLINYWFLDLQYHSSWITCFGCTLQIQNAKSLIWLIFIDWLLIFSFTKQQ